MLQYSHGMRGLPTKLYTYMCSTCEAFRFVLHGIKCVRVYADTNVSTFTSCPSVCCSVVYEMMCTIVLEDANNISAFCANLTIFVEL